MNKRWHDRHKVPRDATDREKLKWHQKHQKACGCRPIPKSLLQKTINPAKPQNSESQ